ncbi:MAG: RDD family protein [Verrucomicrobiota bacterium JB023]|nr:RDD family protein [Verrucomicrobiota bacterium JB023]
MSNETQESETPKPTIPKPNIPKPTIPKPSTPSASVPKPDIPAPNIPKPSIPKPNVPSATQAPPPPVAAEMGPPPAPTPEATPEEESVLDQYADGTFTGGEGVTMQNRLIAGLIDGLVAIGLYWTATLILPGALDFAGWALSSLYWIGRDSLPFLKGQSLGKGALKLKVVKEDGGSLVNDYKTGLIRNILMAIPTPIGALIELIILLSRQDKPEAGRRLGDDWAKTKVVKAEA